MYETLERYLGEVNHYLAVRQGADEILAEIRSHILDKAEHEAGGVTEASLERIVASYGSPREVAAKYMEGLEIISPTFRKHLFRYTGILFAIHLILTAIAVHFRAGIIAFPFFIIPKMPVWMALAYLPMALIYDFGLVALVLLLVTQKRWNARLPWFELSFGRRGGPVLAHPKPVRLVIRLAVFACFLFLLVRYHTIFFYSVNLSAPESLLNPVSSLFFSIMFLAAFACEIGGYWTRFVFNSAWVTLVQDGLVLMILWVIWNGPIRPVYRALHGIDPGVAGGLFVLIFTILAALDFLRNLVRVTREMSLP